MEGHPESSISSKNQQFEPPQVVAQAWTPIHRDRYHHGVRAVFLHDVRGSQSAGRDKLIERTRAGLKSAKAGDGPGWHRPKLTAEQIEMAKGLLASGKAPRDMAKAFGAGRPTLYRYVPGDTSTADEEVVQP